MIEKMKIYKSVTELIGSTPLLEIKNYSKEKCPNATILAKLEYFNPAGSVKDRVAQKMLEDAINEGLINNDTTIIEPTSGNTGIGIASVCASKGIKVILTMPETMSVERRSLLKAYGAKIVLTDGALGMQGAIDKAMELSSTIENSFIPSQFTNPSNPKAHEETTGPEIWNDTLGKVDIFVAGIGTGGTISGVGKYLKEKKPNIKIIGVEPYDSPVLTKGQSGPHKLQGIGAGFVPDTLDRNVIDEIITVKTEEAYTTSDLIAKKEGILVGITSGASVFAAALVGMREENKGKIIVALLPDTGERYMSSDVFS